MKIIRAIALLVGALLLSNVAWGASPAQGRIEFNIPAQPLPDALAVFGRQAGLQVLSRDSHNAAEIMAPAVTGRYSPAEALERMLAQTGLKYEFINDRTVRIAAVDTAGASGMSSLRVARTDHAEGSSGNPSSSGDEATTDRPDGRDDKAAGVQEIVVTAQKRTERLIDTPVSVSVISADALLKLGASQFRDFANTIPGLSFQTAGPGYTQISLRGISVGQDIAPTVAVYVDEVPYGASTTFARGGQITLDAGLFDVSRVEVLRGPQGTLYGASTVGGLIKYVTKQPDAANFGGEAQAGISGTQRGGVNYDIAAAVNVPLVADRLALRASGFESHDGGYIDNIALDKDDVNSSDIRGGRLDLLFTPSERLGIRVNAYLQDTSTNGLPTADYTLGGVALNGSLAQRRLHEESFDQRYRLVSGTLTYDLDQTSLVSVSSYQTIRSRLVADGSVLYLPTLPAGIAASAVGFGDTSSTDKFTQEVRLVSRGARTFDWVIGGFFTREDSSLYAEYLLRGLAGQPLPNTVYTFSGPSTYKEYAAFGDLTWHLTQRMDVTGGVRYAENRQSYEQVGTGTFGLSAPLTRSTENVVTYLANARYRFSDHVAAYVRYATGYRPGGPNLLVQDPITGERLGLPTFEPDQLRSFEGGVKGETADGRFGLELAGYYVDWSNIQINVTRRGFGTKANAPAGATVRGAELTLAARPTEAVAVTGAFAYQNARMSDALAAVAAAKDERLPAVPRVMGSLNADYEFRTATLRPAIGATLRHVGGSKTIFGPNGYALPAYTMVDLRSSVAVKNVTLQLYVRNLFDERAQLTPRFRYFPANIPQVTILQPRTIGIIASTKF